jgi:hypothetical protein
VLNPDVNTHGECFMGGCHEIHVELFTVAGGAVMEITAVGVVDAFLLKALVARKRLIAFTVVGVGPLSRWLV